MVSVVSYDGPSGGAGAGGGARGGASGRGGYGGGNSGAGSGGSDYSYITVDYGSIAGSYWAGVAEYDGVVGCKRGSVFEELCVIATIITAAVPVAGASQVPMRCPTTLLPLQATVVATATATAICSSSSSSLLQQQHMAMLTSSSSSSLGRSMGSSQAAAMVGPT